MTQKGLLYIIDKKYQWKENETKRNPFNGLPYNSKCVKISLGDKQVSF